MLRADELLAGLQEEPLAAGLALREVGAGTELGLDIDGRWRGLIRVEGRVVEELDVPAAELRGNVLQVGRRRFVRLADGT